MAHHRFTPEVVYDYVEELDANLVCAICQSALVDPVTTTSCKHTFCRDCIEKAISVNPQCPIDRSALTTHSLRETEQLVKLILDELKVRCAAEECGVVMQRGLLLAHLRTCPMAVTMCDDGECGLKMPKQRVSEHRAYECFQRKMECDRCGVLLTFKDQTPRHTKSCSQGGRPSAELNTCNLCDEQYDTPKLLHQWSCPAARVPCTHTTRGCPAIIPRWTLAAHLKACPFEAMSAFFIANDARFQAMEDRQEILVKEITSLRSDLQVERALAGTNGWRSLGSAHPIDAGDFIPGSPTDAAIPLSDPSLPAENVDPGRRGSTPHSPEIISPIPSTGSRRVLSGPPPPGITPRAAADFAAPRSLFSPSFGSRQSYADWAFNHLADPAPSTLVGLEAAVARLKRVVLQLAAGLDTMERRNEVRTMTESLRILEEVGALRAIVNTIRLQVMIDRPGTPSLRRAFGTTPTPSTTDIHSVRLEMPTSTHRQSDNIAELNQDETELSSLHESVSFSGQGINAPASNSRAHIWALHDISRRRAGRDANAIGGVGGIVGEPMGMPSSPIASHGPSEDVSEVRSSSRLGRAVSNGLLSIRTGRRNQGPGPRL